MKNPHLLVGLESPDDAGVYQISDDTALVQTVDFFTPIIDDPFIFGQIAAANALSDIYAMGGRPITAMNIVGFPLGKLDISILKDILRGGLNKLAEANVALVGGHSVEDQELKYGMAITGLIHPKKILTKRGAQPGDVLILTKPLGTGIIATALKGNVARNEAVIRMVDSMTTLNRKAAEIIQDMDIHACTDITGFGLIGHACEVARAGNCAIYVHASSIPVFPEAVAYARIGLVPGGCHANRTYYEPFVEYRQPISDELRDVFYDPQTSGGLFFSVSENNQDVLLSKFAQAGVEGFVVGRVEEMPHGKVIIL